VHLYTTGSVSLHLAGLTDVDFAVDFARRFSVVLDDECCRISARFVSTHTHETGIGMVSDCFALCDQFFCLIVR
jgi:hypothetical protein